MGCISHNVCSSLYHSAYDPQPQEGHQLAWLGACVLLSASREHEASSDYLQDLNTEEGVILKKKIKGLLLKPGEVDSGQPKAANVYHEEPRQEQATWSAGGPGDHVIPGASFLPYWLDQSHCPDVGTVVSHSQDRRPSDFQQGAPRSSNELREGESWISLFPGPISEKDLWVEEVY